MLQAKQSKETSSLQYYFVPVRRDKSWHLDRTNRFCCKQKHMSFLLRSQLHILSYSNLDKKHMVLFCCLKNMKICAVITNICVHSKLFQESQTLLDMLKYQWELIVLKGKKTTWSGGATCKAEAGSHRFMEHISKRNTKDWAWLCVCHWWSVWWG